MGIFAGVGTHPWHSKLLPASFRGVKFFVDSHTTTVGRKNVEHGYPNQDDPWYEDMGRKGRKIKVEAYVIQNGANRYDYMVDRDALVTALEAKGPGRLVHPWANSYFKGPLNVVVEGDAEFTEELGTGGICKFSITFATTQEEAAAPAAAIEQPDFSALSNAVSDGISTALNALDAASEAIMLDTAQAFMRTISASCNQIKGAVTGTLGAANGYVAGLVANLGNVINTPCDLANSLLGAVDSAKGIVGMGVDAVTGGVVGGCSGVIRNPFQMDGSSVPRELGRSAVGALINATYFGPGETCSGATPPLPVSGSGEGAAQSTAAQEAISHAGITLTLGTLSEIALVVEYNSANDVTDMTERMATAFDDHLLRLGAATWQGCDDVYQQLEETRDRVMARMQALATALPQELDYTPPAGIETALVLAYRKYKNLDMAEDVELRNRPTLRHPGFLPATTLRILAEAK